MAALFVSQHFKDTNFKGLVRALALSSQSIGSCLPFYYQSLALALLSYKLLVGPLKGCKPFRAFRQVLEGLVGPMNFQAFKRLQKAGPSKGF